MTVSFCPETVFWFFTSALYIQGHFKLDIIMEANIMNADQTASMLPIKHALSNG